MTTATTTQRIYVASLSDYNAGRLHGSWIDLTDVDDIDDVWKQVNAILASSHEQAITGWKAEEWAIHDYEGFGGWRISEYESFETILLVANLIANKGEAFSTFLGNDESILSGAEYHELEEMFDEAYAGEWDTFEDFAENYVEELGWAGMTAEQLEEISSCLDYGKIARDLEADYWFSDGYVFRNC